jgi:hypothetical protein
MFSPPVEGGPLLDGRIGGGGGLAVETEDAMIVGIIADDGVVIVLMEVEA